jgi:hypothetical protein
LQGGIPVAILRVRFTARSTFKANRRQEAKKEVDGWRETLHNLTSLLLTNKTIRKRSKAVPNTEFFNNKQSISVGV